MARGRTLILRIRKKPLKFLRHIMRMEGLENVRLPGLAEVKIDKGS